MARNLCTTSMAMFFNALVQFLFTVCVSAHIHYSRIQTILSIYNKIEAHNALAVQRKIKHMFASWF